MAKLAFTDLKDKLQTHDSHTMISTWEKDLAQKFLHVQTGAVFTTLMLCCLFELRWGQSVNNEASFTLAFLYCY